MVYNIKTKTIDGIKLSWGQADILEVLIKMNGEPLPIKEIANQIDRKYNLIGYKTSVPTTITQMFNLRKKIDGLIKNRPGIGYFIDEEIKLSKETNEEPRKTYEFGLIVGTKRERDYWKDKIKEKIKKLNVEEKTKLKALTGTERCLVKMEYASKENILQELLKGE